MEADEDGQAVERGPIEGTKELLQYWRSASVKEWRRRTLVGKALYPFWFTFSALMWATALLYAGFMISIAWLTHPNSPLWNKMDGSSTDRIIYKEESDDG